MCSEIKSQISLVFLDHLEFWILVSTHRHLLFPLSMECYWRNHHLNLDPESHLLVPNSLCLYFLMVQELSGRTELMAASTCIQHHLHSKREYINWT